MARASNLLCFFAHFLVSGALGRSIPGSTLKRGLKWYPAGLMGWKVASQACLASRGDKNGLNSRFYGHGYSGGFRGPGRAHFRDVLSKTRGPLTHSFLVAQAGFGGLQVWF